MFSLHNSRAFLLLLLVVFALSISINSQPITYNYHVCSDQSNKTANANYKPNLTVQLDSLSTKASQNYSFYNESFNIGIYGLFLCRRDVSNNTCQSCVRYATQDITTRCPSDKSAIIWYDECMLRYSDVNVFGKTQTRPEVLVWTVLSGNTNTTSPDEPSFRPFGTLALMYGLIDETLQIHVLFRADNRPVTVSNGTEQRYGLVQCSRDMDHSACKNCFIQLMQKPKTVANRNKGGVSYPQVAIYGMRTTLSFNKNQLCLHLLGYGRFRQSHSHPISCLHLQGYSRCHRSCCHPISWLHLQGYGLVMVRHVDFDFSWKFPHKIWSWAYILMKPAFF